MELQRCYDYFLGSETSDHEPEDIFHQLKCGIIASTGKDISKVFCSLTFVIALLRLSALTFASENFT